MKITYVRLENVAGLLVGSNLDVLEINFNKSINNIISIAGLNGVGKSVLLSSLNPFATTTSLDDRSTLSYIKPGKAGYKEIHYQNNTDEIIIKHYFKPNKEDSHSVKSYFIMNGDELNKNGNVSSFLELVEIHLGLTQEMMRLMRLGSNVNSIISLTSSRRKEYIGKLIEQIDAYLNIYKKINSDLRTLKVLIANNNNNLQDCHISDIVIERERLEEMNKSIKSDEREHDKLVARIGKIQALEKDNNINDLIRKKQEAEINLYDVEKTERELEELHLINISIDDLINKRNNLISEKIEKQSKLNSYKLSIDNTSSNIERLDLSIKKITSNNSIQSLISLINDLESNIKNTPDIIKSFNKRECHSNDIENIISKLSSFNQIGNMMLTLNSRAISAYLKLKRSNKSIDNFLKEQTKRNISRVSDNDIKRMIDKLFDNDVIIAPSCESEFISCPYYRLSEEINNVKNKLDEEVFDDETLNYIKVISNNIDNILNELDRLSTIDIPDGLRENFKQSLILSNLENKLSLFKISSFSEYLTLIRENEIYSANVLKLKDCKEQLKIFHNAGVDNQLKEIAELKSNIEFYKNNINTLSEQINFINKSLDTIDMHIGLVTKYNSSKPYKQLMQTTIETTNKILIPLQNSAKEKIELQIQLSGLKNKINYQREECKKLDNRINEFNKLTKKALSYDNMYKDYDLIEKSVSTRKGIPVIYMKKYLEKIQNLSNKLLSLIYDGDLTLAKFNVTPDSFEIPYVKNGTKIPDVRYASQSEIPLITMALSFALSSRVSEKYNILLLDEIDAGLDEVNRSAFLKMLYRQIEILNCEQVFIISHNMNQMVNVGMDVIKLSDVTINSRLQNIIYQ